MSLSEKLAALVVSARGSSKFRSTFGTVTALGGPDEAYVRMDAMETGSMGPLPVVTGSVKVDARVLVTYLPDNGVWAVWGASTAGMRGAVLRRRAIWKMSDGNRIYLYTTTTAGRMEAAVVAPSGAVLQTIEVATDSIKSGSGSKDTNVSARKGDVIYIGHCRETWALGTVVQRLAYSASTQTISITATVTQSASPYASSLDLYFDAANNLLHEVYSMGVSIYELRARDPVTLAIVYSTAIVPGGAGVLEHPEGALAGSGGSEFFLFTHDHWTELPYLFRVVASASAHSVVLETGLGNVLEAGSNHIMFDLRLIWDGTHLNLFTDDIHIVTTRRLSANNYETWRVVLGIQSGDFWDYRTYYQTETADLGTGNLSVLCYTYSDLVTITHGIRRIRRMGGVWEAAPGLLMDSVTWLLVPAYPSMLPRISAAPDGSAESVSTTVRFLISPDTETQANNTVAFPDPPLREGVTAI